MKSKAGGAAQPRFVRRQHGIRDLMAPSIDEVLQIVDPTRFSIALSELIARSPRGFAESRPAERVAWCVSELEAEVHNGGFSLFFMNSAGDLAAETADALGRIGAYKTMALVKEAMAVFPPPGPAAARQSRDAQLKALPVSARAIWDRLDKVFFAYPDDLPALIRSFVTAHAADFR